MNGWIQEKYCACNRIGQCWKALNNNEIAIKYFIMAQNFDNERIDSLVDAFELMYLENKKDNYYYLLINAFYHKYKNYELNFEKLDGKLFVDRTKYFHLLEYYNSLASYYVNDQKEGYECVKKILLGKKLKYNLYSTTIKNLQFYKNYFKTDIDKINLSNLNLFFKNQKNIFLYWTGKKYYLLKKLLDIIYYHSKNNKNFFVYFLNDENLNDYVDDIDKKKNHIKLVTNHMGAEKIIKINVDK